MNIIDLIIILFILMFVLAGFKNGVIKEAVSLVGLIAIFVISFKFKEQIGNVLCKYLPFFHFSGRIEGLVSLNVLIYQLVGLFAVASILLGIYSILLKITGLFQKLVNLSFVLAIPSKIGGAIIGAVEGTIIIYVILLVLMIPLNDFNHYRESNLVNKIVYKTPIISKTTKNMTSSISNVYGLIDKVNRRNITTNEANLEIMESMLDYKIVSPKTVEQLIVLDKLKEIDGIEKLVDRYN